MDPAADTERARSPPGGPCPGVSSVSRHVESSLLLVMAFADVSGRAPFSLVFAFRPDTRQGLTVDLTRFGVPANIGPSPADEVRAGAYSSTFRPYGPS